MTIPDKINKMVSVLINIINYIIVNVFNFSIKIYKYMFYEVADDYIDNLFL